MGSTADVVWQVSDVRRQLVALVLALALVVNQRESASNSGPGNDVGGSSRIWRRSRTDLRGVFSLIVQDHVAQAPQLARTLTLNNLAVNQPRRADVKASRHFLQEAIAIISQLPADAVHSKNLEGEVAVVAESNSSPHTSCPSRRGVRREY